jgi:L-threonylcarbamoyladenylate synthase
MSPMIIHLKKNNDPKIFIERAAEIIKEGLLLGYPTDTVYGLGADPLNSSIVQRIFDIKEQPGEIGLPILVADIEEAQKIGIFTEIELKLAKKFWPGELSIIVPLKEPNETWKMVTGGQDTIVLRMPNHPIILEVLRTLKRNGYLGGIIGTSASIYGEDPIIEGKEMCEKFGMMIDFTLEMGKCPGKIPSTIIKLDHKELKEEKSIKAAVQIIREGNITKDK